MSIKSEKEFANVTEESSAPGVVARGDFILEKPAGKRVMNNCNGYEYEITY